MKFKNFNWNKHIHKQRIPMSMSDVKDIYNLSITFCSSRFFVDLSHTKDRRYIIINSNSRTTSELWMIDSQNCQQAPPTLLWPRQDGIECYMDHMGGKFFALTTQGKPAELKVSYIFRIRVLLMGNGSVPCYSIIYLVNRDPFLIYYYLSLPSDMKNKPYCYSKLFAI